jgi:hypothetical protein
MANFEAVPGMLIVPHGTKELHDSFISFLWDRELAAFLVHNEWVKQPESGDTGLGLRVSPGSA